MKITEKDVDYVATLANLALSEQETAQFAADLDSILGYVEKLNQLETFGVEPMAQVLYHAEGVTLLGGTLRADVDRPSLPREQALANAPESAAGQFKVPKVIER